MAPFFAQTDAGRWRVSRKCPPAGQIKYPETQNGRVCARYRLNSAVRSTYVEPDPLPSLNRISDDRVTKCGRRWTRTERQLIASGEPARALCEPLTDKQVRPVLRLEELVSKQREKA